MPRARTAVPAFVASLALVAAGCGTKIVNTENAEKRLKKVIADDVGARVESVSCPDDVEAKAGDRFKCTVTGADGTKGKASVTQRDDEGNVRFEAPFLHVREAEASIAAEIERQTGAAFEVSCPEIVAGEKGLDFECAATAPNGEKGTVEAQMTDDEGHFDFRLKAD